MERAGLGGAVVDRVSIASDADDVVNGLGREAGEAEAVGRQRHQTSPETGGAKATPFHEQLTQGSLRKTGSSAKS